MKTNYCKLIVLFFFVACRPGLNAQTKLSGETPDKPETLASTVKQEQVPTVFSDSVLRLEPVFVLAPKHGRFSDYSAQTVKMSTLDIVTNPASMADILANMRVLPGVQTNDNDGRLIIQGGNSDESKVYINDLIVINPYGLSTKNAAARSRFSPDLFDGVVLQSGGYNAEFGQALSGIVNLNTKEWADMESKTDISVSSVYADITHIDRKPSYAYRANLSYSNLEPYSRLVPDSYEWQKYYRQLQTDFFLTKEFNSRTKMTAMFQGNRAGLAFAYFNVDSVRFNPDLSQTYLYAQINLYHSFNREWSLSLASNIVSDYLSKTNLQYPGDKVNSWIIWNHNKWNLQYSKGKITNKSGVEFVCNPYREIYTFDREYKNQINSEWMSLYNDTKLFITNQLTANIGLRGEYSNYLNRFNLAPRLYLGYALNRRNIVSASIGEYFQLPALEYLKLNDGMDFVVVSKATVSYSYVKRSSKFQLDAYYKKYSREVTWKQGQFQAVDVGNEGKGVAWGADIFLKNDYKFLEYWLTYSYNRTEKKYARFTEMIAPDYVAPHSFNMTVKCWMNLLKSMLGINYNLTAGTPYYDEWSPYDQLGTTPLRNRLDVSWSYLPTSWIVVHFGCQNVLGYRNIYGYEYSTLHSGLRKEITNPNKRFFFLGVFITLSKDKKINQLKTL
ncbi:MAG: hypothetical protein LBP83_08765 [Dysgonamonadaceae bacterium]|jgi:hypothetical protein|nr:hypothetical protein [Dysgonamonadaceae bacterium]